MSTDLQRRPSGHRLDRLVARILDPDGVTYGDERERLRFYEGSTVAAGLQAVLVPWTLLACALLGGRPVAPVVVPVAAAFLIPLCVGSAYVRRRRVRTTPSRFTAGWVVTTLLVTLPYPLLFLVVAGQFAAGTDHGPARSFVDGAIGGVLAGLVVAAIALARKRHIEHRRVPEDDE